jgi:uncharacterized membrane protein
MLTIIGLRRVKSAVIKFAQPSDTELNAILQEAVRALNQLIASRSIRINDEKSN